MMKIKNTIKYLAIAAIFAIMPAISHADHSDSWGGDYGGWDSSGDIYGESTYYAPSYDYYSDYTPYSYDYGNEDYYGGDYGGSSYQPYSYGGSSAGGYSYNPGYSYGGSASYPQYTYNSSTIAPSTPAYSNSTSGATSGSNANATNNNQNSASAVASSSNTNNNVNVNNNNVYVYTNPQGTAVLNNPQFQRLDGYCVITPNNPSVGQTVTATAYATGGIGSYSYTWGGDLTYGSGASTQFTSYNAGTKNVTVTVRSGEEVITKNCSVTFGGGSNYYAPTYTGSSVSVSRVNSGTPVGGVFVQPGTPVSGVYLNQLPATGISLTWVHYMVGFLALVLGSVVLMISRSRKQLLAQAR